MSDAYNAHQLAFNSYSNQEVIFNQVPAIAVTVIENTVRGYNVFDVEKRKPFYVFRAGSIVPVGNHKPYGVRQQEDCIIKDSLFNAIEGGQKFGYRTADLPNIRYLQHMFSTSWDAITTVNGAGSFVGGWERMLKIG